MKAVLLMLVSIAIILVVVVASAYVIRMHEQGTPKNSWVKTAEIIMLTEPGLILAIFLVISAGYWLITKLF